MFQARQDGSMMHRGRDLLTRYMGTAGDDGAAAPESGDEEMVEADMEYDMMYEDSMAPMSDMGPPCGSGGEPVCAGDQLDGVHLGW